MSCVYRNKQLLYERIVTSQIYAGVVNESVSVCGKRQTTCAKVVTYYPIELSCTHTFDILVGASGVQGSPVKPCYVESDDIYSDAWIVQTQTTKRTHRAGTS